MAFNKTQSTKSRNQFSARLVSNNTNATVSFINITEDFSRKVCGCSVEDMTFAQAEQLLPQIFDNDRYTCVITDLTAEREIIPLADF